MPVSSVAVLTAGGDCPGLNAGVVEAVSLLRAADVKVCGIADGYQGLVRAGLGEAGPTVVDVSGLDLHRVARQGGSVLGASRTNLSRDELFKAAMAGVERLGIDALVMFGGDGSLRSAARFAAAGVPVVAAPKTVDNDVAMSERSIGFSTATDSVLSALDRLADTAETHGTLFVVEVMGRRSGFLAAAAAEAARVDGLAVPERPWTLSGLVERAGTRKGAIIVVAEGAWPSDLEGRGIDRHGNPTVGGVVPQIVGALDSRFRAVVLGHVVRGGVPNAEDRLLAQRFVRVGVPEVLEGRSAAVLVRDGRVVVEDISAVTAGRRFLDQSALAALGSLLLD